MRKVLLIGGALLALVLGGLSLKMMVLTADIRPDSLSKGISKDAARKGRFWLERSALAHGGRARWRQLRDARFVLTDSWPNPVVRATSMDWPKDDQKLELAFLTGKDNGRLTFLDGPTEGAVWGVQNWVTWTQPKGGKPAYAPDDTVKFWVPTITYFLELPFRLPEGGVVAYAGEETLFGRPHAKIYVTWGSGEADPKVDQYVVYIDQETHLVGCVFYTVRDMMPGVTGAMRYQDYRDVEGLKIAFEMTATPEPDISFVIHRMVVSEGRFGVGKTDDYYVPAPERAAKK